MNFPDRLSRDFTIIFVGRVARNKAQHDIIKIAFFYKQINPDFKPISHRWNNRYLI